MINKNCEHEGSGKPTGRNTGRAPRVDVTAHYEAIGREGRNRSLNNAQKHTVWTLLQAYQDELDRAGTYDWTDVLSAALNGLAHTGRSSAL